MMMPDKLALELYRFYGAIIDLADQAWIAIILKFAEFFRKIYGMHAVLLKLLNCLTLCAQNSLCCVAPRSLRINAQKVFCARRADHNPADVGEIEFDAVHVFSPLDGPFLKLCELFVREVRNGFLLLG